MYSNPNTTLNVYALKKNPCKLEKLSTKIKINRLPLRVLILIGPNKSICINSKGLDIMISLIDLKEDLVCFSSWHASQMRSFSNSKVGIPFIDFLKLIRNR